MTGTDSRIFSEYCYVFLDDFFPLLQECSADSRFEYRNIDTDISREDTKEIGILVLVIDEWVDHDILRTQVRNSCFDFFYPLLVRDQESTWTEVAEIRGDVLLVEGDDDIDRLGDVWLLARDVDIIIVESTLDDRLVLTIRDDMLSERGERVRDDIHDRVHSETCRSGNTDGEVCILHAGIIDEKGQKAKKIT